MWFNHQGLNNSSDLKDGANSDSGSAVSSSCDNTTVVPESVDKNIPNTVDSSKVAGEQAVDSTVSSSSALVSSSNSMVLPDFLPLSSGNDDKVTSTISIKPQTDNNQTETASNNNSSVIANGTHNSSPFSLSNRFKRKRENRASTFALQHNAKPLIGEFGGCPWRNQRDKYDLGVVGYVY